MLFSIENPIIKENLYLTYLFVKSLVTYFDHSFDILTMVEASQKKPQIRYGGGDNARGLAFGVGGFA